jgi:hypothetical protein
MSGSGHAPFLLHAVEFAEILGDWIRVRVPEAAT